LQLWGEVSLPDCAGWSELLFFQKVAVAMPFSCSSVWSIHPPARWGNSVLNVVLCPVRSTGIHYLPNFGRLTCHLIPSLILCASPNLCWVLVNPMGGWLTALPRSQSLLFYPHLFTESSVLRVCFLAPPQFSGAGSAFHLHLHCQCWITVHCLCFSVLLESVSFCSVCPGAALYYVPGEWVGESHMVHDVQLFFLQIHTSSFGAGQWGKVMPLFSVCKEVFYRLGVQDFSEFDLDWYSVFCFFGRKKKRQKWGQGGFFPQGWTHLADCATWDFHGC
jgi:hypothetical protein